MSDPRRPLTGVELRASRAFAESLAALGLGTEDDRRLASEIILSLLDEIERLKATFVPRVVPVPRKLHEIYDAHGNVRGNSEPVR